MPDKHIYMDYNATTPLHPEVKDTLIASFDLYANASSVHSDGRKVRQYVENARKAVAEILNANPMEITFTGGGSESNNTVLKMIDCRSNMCSCCGKEKSEIIVSAIEHPSVLNTAEFMEHEGGTVHYVGVDSTGKIDMVHFRKLLNENTSLVSIMMANNEIGTIQDLKEITDLAHEMGALVHTDAVQAVGKVPVDVKQLDVDFLSFSGHKIGGPKGIGVLYVKQGAPYCTFIHGGHQEDGRRAGTYNSTGIIGIGKAVEVALREMETETARIQVLRDRLKDGILNHVPDVHLNGHETDCLPGTLNVSFLGAEGEAILLYLDLEGISVSTGSACASGSLDPSHVLLATGVGAELAHGSIRFSLGRENSEADVDYVLQKLPQIIEKIRSMSTVYSKGA